MKSPEVHDGQDATAGEEVARGGDGSSRSAGRRPPDGGLGIAIAGQDEPGPGPALGAGDRLRVKPAIARIAVFGGAPTAHRETLHGGGRPVVGQPLDDREPWATVGAGDEGMAVATVGGVAHLGQARRAGGDVGGHERARAGAGRALEDPEPAGRLGGLRRNLHGGDPIDDGQPRRLGRDGRLERRHRLARPLHFRHDAGGRVLDEAGEPQTRGLPPDERAESHALHDTGDGEPPADHWGQV